MEFELFLVLAVLSSICIGLTIFTYKKWTRCRSLESKYELNIRADEDLESARREKSKVETDIEALRSVYREKRSIFDGLVKQAAIYDEEIQLAELGFYKPHYDYDTSPAYKAEREKIRSEQKKMVSGKTAVVCNTEWTVRGSKTEGRKMTNQGIRLTARAFNNECDAAISNVQWNNVTRMEQRVVKAFEAINKLNVTNSIEISSRYLDLKIRELRLAFEYQDMKKREKDEQAEIRRQMREEAKLAQEVEQAEKEEEKFERLLGKATQDAAKAHGAELEKLQAKISLLNDELREAHAKAERAKSMAQQTRAGHVYVVSNVGSFGENVFKVGMTRRLEPLDRVKELGDASVPFDFDIHAMIYSEDAPALESSLHSSLDSRRVNLVNPRKEFFNVSLDDLRERIRQYDPRADFFETIEARQFRESEAIRAEREHRRTKSDTRSVMPESI